MARRRPSGDGMVRKRDDGRWEGRIVVGHKENGDSIFRYIYADTQKELTAKLRQNIDIYQGADLTEMSRITLSDWLDQWLENIADTLRPNTLRNYRSYIENHIRPSLGDRQLARITPKDVQRFYEKLGDSLSSGTVRRIHTTLHGALKAAQQAHLIAGNPTEKITPPKFSYGPKQVLTDEQLDTFMKVIADDDIWYDFFYTELTTGLRRGEICGLKWEDFDEINGTLKVCRTVHRKDGGGLTAGDTKTYTGIRKIVLPASTAAVLRKRKKCALTEWIFPNPLKPEQPTDPDSAYTRLKILLKQAGLPSIRFHDLRHTFSTHALASGVDVKTLSGILGHARAAFTLDTYTHATGDMQKRASEIVGDFMAASAKVKADMPFGEWVEFWCENHSRPQLRPSSQRSYEGYIRLYILPTLGSIPLNKLTANDLQQFFNWMKKDGRSEYRESRGEGLSDSMIRNCHSLCRRVLERAVAERLIVQNPAEGCKLPPVRRKEMQILSREELQKLLIQAKDEGYYEAFLLELATGLRVGELMALQWNDLNFKTGELRIERQAYRVKGELLIQPPKTKAAIRTVILPPPVVEALRAYKQAVSSRWVFPSPKKEDAPLAPAAASHRLAKILNHAGCKKARFHDLRHVFATNALEHGMDVKTLSTIIGHVSSATTLNVYAHVTDDMQRQAAAKIDQGIGKVRTSSECPTTTARRAMTDFKPKRGRNRYWGSGYLGQTKGGRWNGRYTVAWPDGTKRTRNVYAATRDECEKLLTSMIVEMKTEVTAERERLKAEGKAN